MKQLEVSEKEIDIAIKNMVRRHPFENWMYVRNASNNQKTTYISNEGIEWLKQVYFNRNKFYLDLDILFFENLVKILEEKNNLPHKNKVYDDMNIKSLMSLFNKSRIALDTAISRMNKRTGKDYKEIIDGEVIIKSDGVKWLYEKYFRLAYLEELENYKLELERKSYDREKIKA